MTSPDAPRVALISKEPHLTLQFRGALIRDLVRRGITTYVLLPDYNDDARARVRQMGAHPVGYSLAPVGTNPLRDSVDLVRLAALLRRLHLNAVMTFFTKPVIYGLLAARLAGVPRRYGMVEGAGHLLHDERLSSLAGKGLHLIARALYRRALAQTHGVFMLNSADIELFTSLGLARREQITHLPGIGVELESYRPVRAVQEPVTFILAARLIRTKGIREFVEAARRLRARYAHTRFILLGAADSNPACVSHDEVAGWVREGLIEWPGMVTDVRPWLAEASVFVLPSYYREGVPRSNQEALAMGRPVITTDWIGCRDTVLEGRNGFLVTPRDVDDLTAAMTRFCENPRLIPRMGAESRRLAERRFDVHAINARIIDTLIPETAPAGADDYAVAV